MEYQIKRGTNTVLEVTPTGRLQQRIMAGNTVQMEFTHSSVVELFLGDYVDIYGERFYMNRLPSITKVSENEYTYNAEFQALSYELGKTLYQTYGDGNVLKERSFSLMGTARVFLNLLVQNANRNAPAGLEWKIGECVDSEEKNLTFDGESCLSVLSRLAEEFDTEWWVDVDGYIHLKKREFGSGQVFKYGRNNGLYQISRETSQKDLFTRLFADGSTKNIPSGYRGRKSRLQLPASITAGYLERNANVYGKIENSVTYDDIYPKYVGTITNYTDHLTVGDFNIDFDLNLHLLPDIKVKLVVLSGQLAGYMFEIESYNHATKTFKIIPNADEKALEVPSPLLKLEVGDKYTFEGLSMPDSYITNAENELLARATQYLNENSDIQVRYVVVCNPIYFKLNNIHVDLGNTARVIDTDLNVDKDIRVVGLSRSLQDWFDYTIELSDQKIQIPDIVRTYQKIQTADKVIRRYDLLNPARARMAWRNAEELRTMVFDTEGYYYSGAIRPLSIETQMLTVGSRSQQFLLNGVTIDHNYLSNPNRIRITTGTLVHYTIADPIIKSWTLAAYSNDTLSPATAYYIYARCAKNGTTGTYRLTNVAVKVDEDPTFYHFLIGVLHTPIDNVRAISFTYGQTTINGKFIRTGTIYSQDGLTYFDLDNGEIGGRIKFVSSSGTTYQTADELIQAALDEYQPDGQIVLWVENYAPTLSNAPASSWTTTTVRRDHVGDLFYNTVTNIGYRFTETSTNVFAWVVESNHGIIKAMQAAAEAQDTADGKRRIFTTTPVTPYDVGDLWTQGPTGNIMRCITARASGAFVAADWQKADKYTDDTLAQQAQSAADTASANATIANQRIADISNDNLLTPGEKQQLQLQWVQVQGEYPIKVSQAANYSVSTSAYTSAYNALSSYITPLLSNLNTTTAITGATLRANWKAYTDAAVDLSKAVTDAAKALIASGEANLGQLAYLDMVEKARLGTTIIDGGFIRADLLSASRIVSLGIESQSGATAKANASLTSAQGYTDNRFSTLGGFAFISQLTSAAQIADALISAQKLGATVITGGHIATNLLDSDIVRATIIRAAYIEGETFNFVRGSVGGFTMGADVLKNTNGGLTFEIYSGANPRMYMRNTGNDSWVYIYPHGMRYDAYGLSSYTATFPEITGTFLRRAVIDVTMKQDGRGNGGGGWGGLDTVNRYYSAIYAQAYTLNSNAATLEGHVYVGGTLSVNWNMRVIGMQGTWQTAETKVPVYWGVDTGELYHG